MGAPVDQGQIDLRMLEYIHDSGDSRTTAVGIGDLITHHGHESECRDWLVSTQDRGLVRKDARLYPFYSLTTDGLRLVESARARRADPGPRRRVLQDRLLAWIDGQCPAVGDATARADLFLDDPLSIADNTPFTIEQVREAVDFLVDQELVRSNVSAWGAKHIIVSITHTGRACVDAGAGVTAYLARQSAPAQQFNIQANGGTFTIAAGHGSTANAASSSVNVDAALTLAQAIEQALPSLGLGEEAERYLADLRDTSDQGKMVRALSWFGRLSNDTSASALGQMLGTMALAAMGAS